ncbi:MAG: glycosyltransferase family 4 protein [Tepidisphaerales bacterium]
MRVLMLGWEFPPFITGGLGTACYGLTRALSVLGHDIVFVLPRPAATPFSSQVTLAPPTTPGAAPRPVEMQLEPFERVVFRTVESAGPRGPSGAYDRPAPTQVSVVRETIVTQRVREARPDESATPRRPPPGAEGPEPPPPPSPYPKDLLAEVQRYADLVRELATRERFDVIHAHDWMTFPAALAVAAATNKPLVVHVHSTEFDRAGNNVDQRVYDIERRGMQGAARVIAVSHLTRSLCVSHYGVDPSKVEVIHNAVELPHGPAGRAAELPTTFRIAANEKIVLFLGRITFQKGPEYFLAAARRVLEVLPNVRFVMAGTGDLVRQVMDLAVQMGIGSKVLFTGFLRGPDVQRLYDLADVYVMPSVSEPFGIAPLEAMRQGVPVIISRQSGVAEVLKHALKVDFWDVGDLADKIIAVLRHPPLAAALREHGALEVSRLSWADAARAVEDVYRKAMSWLPPTPRTPAVLTPPANRPTAAATLAPPRR